MVIQVRIIVILCILSNDPFCKKIVKSRLVQSESSIRYIDSSLYSKIHSISLLWPRPMFGSLSS
jgi:hypothetical protein